MSVNYKNKIENILERKFEQQKAVMKAFQTRKELKKKGLFLILRCLPIIEIKFVIILFYFVILNE